MTPIATSLTWRGVSGVSAERNVANAVATAAMMPVWMTQKNVHP